MRSYAAQNNNIQREQRDRINTRALKSPDARAYNITYVPAIL